MSSRCIRVVAAIICHRGKYLVAKRARHKPQGGFWEFPGGKIDPGEFPKDALARELREELNARELVIGDFVGAKDHCYGDCVVRIEAYWVQCDPASLHCLEHEAIAWLSPQELLGVQLAPADRFLLPLLTVLNDQD